MMHLNLASVYFWCSCALMRSCTDKFQLPDQSVKSWTHIDQVSFWCYWQLNTMWNMMTSKRCWNREIGLTLAVVYLAFVCRKSHRLWSLTVLASCNNCLGRLRIYLLLSGRFIFIFFNKSDLIVWFLICDAHQKLFVSVDCRIVLWCTYDAVVKTCLGFESLLGDYDLSVEARYDCLRWQSQKHLA